MPRVPRLTTPQVAPQPRPMVAESAAMQPEAVAANVLGTIAKVADEARQKANAIRLNEAEVEARRLRTSILLDPQRGVLNRQRQAAFDAPEVAGREWDMGVSRIASTLNADVREAFLSRANQIRAEIEDQTFRHVRQQMDVVDRETAEALRTDLLNQIVDDPQNEAVVAQSLARAEEVERGLLTRRGVVGEAQDKAVAELRSRAALARITALAETNPSVARETLTRVEDQLQGKDKLDAQRLVRAGTLAVESQAARDQLLAEFPTDEAAALKAVSDRYSGEMEDVVRQRVEAAFADQRRLQAQATNDLFNDLAVVAQTGDLASRQADVERLRELDPAKARRLEAYATQARTGRAAETDWETWDRLTNLNTEQLREINPLEYRAELADREYNALNRMVQRARGTGEFAREQAGMSEAQLTNTAFEEAQRLELLPRNITSARALKGEDGVRFSQLMDEIQAEMDRRVAAQNGRPLSRQEQREAINAVYDDLVMENVGTIRRNRMVPRAMVLNTETMRELTPEERTEVQAGRVPRPIAGETREQYWNRLVQRGIAPDSATAYAMREIAP